MDPMSECPVCRCPFGPHTIDLHINSHSKEEILAAFLHQRQGQGGPYHGEIPFPQRRSNPIPSGSIPMLNPQPMSLNKNPPPTHVPLTQPFDLSMSAANAQPQGPPILMPPMIGMMQVMSPCFIPQQSGPPLFVNMPSYIYPNVGLMGSMLAAANSTAGLINPSVRDMPMPSQNLSGYGPKVNLTMPGQPPILLPTQPLQYPQETSGPRNYDPPSPNVVLDDGSASDDSIISVEDHKPPIKSGQLELRSSSQSSDMEDSSMSSDRIISVKYEHSVRRNEHSVRSNEHSVRSNEHSVRSNEPSTSSGHLARSNDPKASIALLKFEQFLQNKTFPDVNLTDETGLDLSSHLKPEIEISNDSPSFSRTSYRNQEEVEEINFKTESTNGSSDDVKPNVCSFKTIMDIENALKSDEDIQIVVPNELLETAEFKALLASLGAFSQTPSDSGARCLAPPNTPAVTRPPSVSLSPQPCSSRDITMARSVPSTVTTLQSDDSDDDITYQDLVAMETMEDADDDHFFNTSHEELRKDIGPLSSSEFTCLSCGLRMMSHSDLISHAPCCSSKKKRGKGIGKKSSTKIVKKLSTPSEPSLEDSNANIDSSSMKKWPCVSIDGLAIKSEQSSVLSASDLIRTDTLSSVSLKLENTDTCSQPALAAAGQKNWKCNQCKIVFDKGPDLWAHLEDIRNAEQKCLICHLIFTDKKYSISHKKKFHSTKLKAETAEIVMPNLNGEYICGKCDRAFKDIDLLQKHQSCHNEEKPFECLECGKKFGKATLLRDHRKRHFEVGTFSCSFCPKKFFTPSKQREHERIHTGEAPLSCNICAKTFKRHSNLSEHKRIHQTDRPVKPPKELFCHCGKVFSTQRDLDWHKEGEHDKIPKKCTHCGEIFTHSSSLTRHIRLKHEKNFMPADKKENLYAKCHVCEQTFYKTSISKHIRIVHQGSRSFQCDVCKMSFVSKSNLMNHQWQHKGVRLRPFKCQLCNKAYIRKSLLDCHMRMHKGIKPFVCNECGLQFANKSNWQRHVQEHSGTRNYPCNLCDKRFSRQYYLADHLKTHTGEKPYVCGICGKTAATRSNYNSHLRTHITREPINSEV